MKGQRCPICNTFLYYESLQLILLDIYGWSISANCSDSSHSRRCLGLGRAREVRLPSITMSARKLARLKKRARGVTSVLATATKSLHSRFNLRRIILAADADGHRDAAELVAIHRYVMTETRIGSLPFWMCLDMEKQRHLCKYLKHHFVARAADKPKTLKINPNAPGSALYLTICGEVTRTESGSSKRTSRVMDGSLLGGIFIPDKMRELLVMERQQKLRHELQVQ